MDFYEIGTILLVLCKLRHISLKANSLYLWQRNVGHKCKRVSCFILKTSNLHI